MIQTILHFLLLAAKVFMLYVALKMSIVWLNSQLSRLMELFKDGRSNTPTAENVEFMIWSWAIFYLLQLL